MSREGVLTDPSRNWNLPQFVMHDPHFVKEFGFEKCGGRERERERADVICAGVKCEGVSCADVQVYNVQMQNVKM